MEQLIDIRRPVTVCKASAGTGKTYTLAAYYVGLLLSGEDYRSILAITFTNKATAEMSERILGYLHSLSLGGERAFLERARRFMIRDAGAPDEVLEQRAGECFSRMLLDYDNVQIQTIDSFLQTLLNGLASVLQMNAGLTTELDIDHVIRQAVDQLLTTDMTDEVRDILEDYMQLKLDEESHWDVRKSLCAMAKELYNESVQMLDADGLILFDAAAVARRRERIESDWEKDAGVAELAELLSRCDLENYNRYTKAAYERIKRSIDNPAKVTPKDRFRGVADKYCNAAEMAQASELAERIGRRYNTLQLTIRFSRDVELMSALQTLIQRNLAEANCALLARTASTLSNALRDGDADFILEKAGIRYHHILMDEFQDTSRLQWNVIRQLLMDVLAGAGNTLLVVGDIKQSIYRWRNGDWHIMDNLENENFCGQEGERINGRFTSLTQNFRSSEEVVRFNLSFFDHIVRSAKDPLTERIYSEGYSPAKIDGFYQSEKKKGGFVHFKAFQNAKKEELARDMFDAMEELLAQGALPSDMMVLVREKQEAVLICDLKAQLPEEHYPLLSKADIVSADSFLLEASAAVQTVIAGLNAVVKGDKVAERYVEMTVKRTGVIEQMHDKIDAKTPLYEAVCELIRLLLADKDGEYKGTETAYINALLDYTRAYVSAYGSRAEDFLIYWDDTLHAKPIPAPTTDAIRIMTVHASKGLQAQTLFVPFCMWPMEAGRHPVKIWCRVAEEIGGDDYVPVQDGAEMAESAYRAEYDEEHVNMRIDNLNMLYVALTRAEDNLYVSTAYSVNKDGKPGVCNHVGKYIMDYAGDEYRAGTPVIKQPQTTSNDLQQPPTLWAELWANSDQVRFVQSQEGALYTDYGDEAYRRLARMDEGVLCHEIFAHVHKADELEAVLDTFETQGEIASKEQRQKLKKLISSAWKGSEEMRDWFTAPWELRLEEAIYMDRRELRPDRVMINPQTNEAVVLDYKFGGKDKKYHAQVNEYKEALRRIGYTPVRGFLWYARTNTLEEVK